VNKERVKAQRIVRTAIPLSIPTDTHSTSGITGPLMVRAMGGITKEVPMNVNVEIPLEIVTDTELLDFLQVLNSEARYTGRCILRLSPHGRGWRLHETSEGNAYWSVREAIRQFMKAYQEEAGS